jgi:3-hydroxybutyrate dehydrogenase
VSGSLSGKTAFITGSERGIGKSIALAMAGAGARVAAHGLAGQAESQALVKELERAGSPEAVFFGGDLRHLAAIDKLMSEVLAWGAPCVLVNNAGIQHTDPIESIAVQTWDDILAVNLSAAFHTMRYTLPLMARNGFGRVINIASVHGLVGSLHKSPYVAAKFGLVGLSKVAALEYATAGSAESGGVTVNCICPGWVDTALVAPQVAERRSQLGVSTEEAIEAMLAEKQPSRRLSSAAEIARLAVFLCDRDAHNITGTAIPVDGGWTAQ